MWAMWPLRSRCPLAPPVLSFARAGSTQGESQSLTPYNPPQPSPDTPLPPSPAPAAVLLLETHDVSQYPPPSTSVSPKHARVGEDQWCNRLFKHLKNRSTFQRWRAGTFGQRFSYHGQRWKSWRYVRGKTNECLMKGQPGWQMKLYAATLLVYLDYETISLPNLSNGAR